MPQNYFARTTIRCKILRACLFIGAYSLEDNYATSSKCNLFIQFLNKLRRVTMNILTMQKMNFTYFLLPSVESELEIS